MGISEELQEISIQLKTQHNSYTTLPIYTVQQRRRMYGMDPDYGGEVVWIYSDEGDEVDKVKADRLEEQYTETCDIPEDYIRTSYIDTWEYVTMFFTRKAAQEYIDKYHYNMNDPRIYVDSGYRNKEWELVRNHLMSLTKTVAEVHEANLEALKDAPVIVDSEDLPDTEPL